MAETCMLESCDQITGGLPGTFHSAECYSEWLSVRLYEATDNYNPFAAYQAIVPILLKESDTPPAPLVLQPWYHGEISA